MGWELEQKLMERGLWGLTSEQKYAKALEEGNPHIISIVKMMVSEENERKVILAELSKARKEKDTLKIEEIKIRVAKMLSSKDEPQNVINPPMNIFAKLRNSCSFVKILSRKCKKGFWRFNIPMRPEKLHVESNTPVTIRISNVEPLTIKRRNLGKFSKTQEKKDLERISNSRIFDRADKKRISTKEEALIGIQDTNRHKADSKYVRRSKSCRRRKVI